MQTTVTPVPLEGEQVNRLVVVIDVRVTPAGSVSVTATLDVATVPTLLTVRT